MACHEEEGGQLRSGVLGLCKVRFCFCLLFYPNLDFKIAGLIAVGMWGRPVGPEGEQKGLATAVGEVAAGAPPGRDGGRSGEWRCNFFMWGSDWSGN